MRAKEFIIEDYKTAKVAFVNQGIDPDEVAQALTDYKSLVTRNQFKDQEKNIDWWVKNKPWAEFKQAVEKQIITPSTTQIKRATLSGNAIDLSNELGLQDKWQIVVPLDIEASCHYGKNTDWCTAKRTPFYGSYIAKGIILIYCQYLKTNKKWAISVNDNSVQSYTANDHPLEDGQFNKATGLSIDSIVSAAKKHLGEILAARDKLIKTDPWVAYPYARDILRQRSPEIEKVVMQNPMASARYARDVIKGEWPEAEQLINSDPAATEFYNKHIGHSE